jgi:hypothetical protein
MSAEHWSDGVSHLGREVEPFLRSLLTTGDRSVLYVAGAGFDPRAMHLARIISETGVRRFGVFIREERPDAIDELCERGQRSEEQLCAAFPDHDVLRINIFAENNSAVVGGTDTLTKLRDRGIAPGGRLAAATDVIVDLSALSIGISFPIVGLLHELISRDYPDINLHVLAATGGPRIEGSIVEEYAEGHQNPKGLKGKATGGNPPTILWIPQLSSANERAYRQLFDGIKPRETCPVLPFPSRNPRGVEEMLQYFTREIADEWHVEPHQMLYAAEDDPLDLYRSISRIHRARKLIYEGAGLKAETVLSPIGSKAMAIGALLAAIQHDLPVAYVEARRYRPPVDGWTDDPDSAGFVHVWMLGEVYPRLAPAP